MLIRAYRLSDRLGIVILKSGSGIGSLALDGVHVLLFSTQRSAGGILKTLLTFLLLIAATIQQIILRIYRILAYIFGTVASVGAGAGQIGLRMSGRTARVAGSSATGAMARRSARAQIDSEIIEDPLRKQNRVLSGFVIIVLAALIGVVIWATDNSDAPENFTPINVNLNAGAVEGTPQESVQQAALNIASPVPTATDIPEVLQAQGTIAYVRREENGQTDIWAVPVGSRDSIRLINSPEDDRDPAWDPNGLRLAYASRKDGNWELYIYDLLTDTTTRMTVNLAFEANPEWSPDGAYLVYESYQTNSHIDLFYMRSDGTEPPQLLPGSSDAPDFSPAWSPDGRRVAFVSWREGNQDIYIFSLSTQELTNITNTPNRQEDYPAWSPDGEYIAFSAVEAGIETVFVKRVDDINAPAEALRRGRTPAWSPDGGSTAFAVDTSDRSNTLITVAPFINTGAATEVIQTPFGTQNPVWTIGTLPPALVNSGGLPLSGDDPLYVEQAQESNSDPLYQLGSLVNISGVELAFLSDRVNDSFNALRIEANDVIGWDFLGQLSDALWDLNYRPPPGVPNRNWHRTGRAFSFNRNQILGFPPSIEVVREDTDLDTNWRIFVRVSDDAQNGQLGEPMRRMPWDFVSRDSGDVEAYDNGGRLRDEMPKGYYVDLTQLAADYDWIAPPAGRDWRDNFDVRNYWIFEKREGLVWYDAMRELYTEGELGSWVPTPTAAPLPTVETSGG
jgi:TolB protein